jgi:excisionase family DNA binding protein
MLVNEPNAKTLLNNTQAAEYLGVTPSTLEVWRSTKRYVIPYVKVGRLIRYRLSALEAFIQSRTVI